MAEFSNAHILASVVAYWSQPAISSLTASKLSNMPFIHNIEQSLVRTNLIGQNYKIATDIEPFMGVIFEKLSVPALEKYFSSINDESLPSVAHGIVDTAILQGSFSVLDGVITFEQEDLMELKALLNQNLPLKKVSGYKVKNNLKSNTHEQHE